jgi:hypothetical protein
MRSTLVLGLLLVASTSQAQLRLSFVGAENVSLASFDETVDNAITFDLNALRGELVDGVEWHAGFRVKDHGASGFPYLLNTAAWYQCGSYPASGDFTVLVELWNERGESADWGAMDQDDEGWKNLEGGRWNGREPSEYSHMMVMFASRPMLLPGGPVLGTGCVRYFWIPIIWQESPIATEPATFGKIRALYR